MVWLIPHSCRSSPSMRCSRRVADLISRPKSRTSRLLAARAAAVHAQVVEKYFVEPLTADDYTRLTEALGEIDKALRKDNG